MFGMVEEPLIEYLPHLTTGQQELPSSVLATAPEVEAWDVGLGGDKDVRGGVGKDVGNMM